MNHALLSRPSNISQRSVGILPRIGQILSLRQQRRSLAQLGPEALNDIGLTPEEAQREAKRPFWDAPTTGRR
jgi:uncharacterized protein YjiS (DUF1127 family)